MHAFLNTAHGHLCYRGGSTIHPWLDHQGLARRWLGVSVGLGGIHPARRRVILHRRGTLSVGVIVPWHFSEPWKLSNWLSPDLIATESLCLGGELEQDPQGYDKHDEQGPRKGLNYFHLIAISLKVCSSPILRRHCLTSQAITLKWTDDICSPGPHSKPEYAQDEQLQRLCIRLRPLQTQ